MRHVVILPYLCILLSGFRPAQAIAQDYLKGKIEQRNAQERLKRPTTVEFFRPGAGAAKLDTASLQGKGKEEILNGLIDLQDFSLMKKENTGNTTTSKNLVDSSDPEKEESQGELVIHWEKWHQKVCKTIYERWLSVGHTPGQAKVTFTISKQGSINFFIENYQLPHYMQDTHSYSLSQSFEDSVFSCLTGIENDPILEFPRGSHRSSVKIEARFAAHMDEGTGGYSWRKDDFEHLPAASK